MAARHVLAGEELTGGTRAGRCFVLRGRCRYELHAGAVELPAGDVADLPEGSFSFRVLGDEEVRLIKCWELPPFFWVTEADVDVLRESWVACGAESDMGFWWLAPECRVSSTSRHSRTRDWDSSNV